MMHGGRVRTLDRVGRLAQGVAIRHGRVVAVGSDADVLCWAHSGDEIIDLHGRTVLPGLIDAHAHVELGTYANSWWTDVRSVGRAECLNRLKRAAAEPGSGWVVGQATYGQDLPDRDELDAIAPATPLLIRWSMHLLVANSVALRKARIDRTFSPPTGSRVRRDENGEPTGVVEEGFDLFPVPYPDVDWLTRNLRRELLTSFAPYGVTTIHELPATTSGTHAWQLLARQAELPARIILNPIVAPGHQPTIADVDHFLDAGFVTGFGDEWLRLGALKVFVDGDEAAAYSYEQLSDAPAGWGLLTQSLNDLANLLSACFRARQQVWMHAIGDAAQDLALESIAQAVTRSPGWEHRTRIEHIANHGIRADQLDRMRRLGVIPVPTAAFMHVTAPEQTGPGDCYPYRRLIDAGLRPPGNSDTAGTQPFATNPWFGISRMANRRNKKGEPLSPGQRVDVAEAITTYTAHGAFAGFEEQTKGSIEIGKLGDLAVFGRDPVNCDPARIEDVTADVTVVGGHIVHDRSGT
ncbi:MAG: amidohydrolase family protein [Streptosporangiales bacterium]|nr:amidohydrolase family protein [Streptosporangiales bacterium]